MREPKDEAIKLVQDQLQIQPPGLIELGYKSSSLYEWAVLSADMCAIHAQYENKEGTLRRIYWDTVRVEINKLKNA